MEEGGNVVSFRSYYKSTADLAITNLWLSYNRALLMGKWVVPAIHTHARLRTHDETHLFRYKYGTGQPALDDAMADNWFSPSRWLFRKGWPLADARRYGIRAAGNKLSDDFVVWSKLTVRSWLIWVGLFFFGRDINLMEILVWVNCWWHLIWWFEQMFHRKYYMVS